MIGDKLTALLESKNIKAGTLASLTGIPKSTIYSIIKRNNKSVDFSVMLKIADALDVPVEYFYDRDPSKGIGAIPAGFEPMPKMKTVPLLGTIACGEPILAAENIEMDVAMPEHVIADFALRCKGDSMIEARIHDGDVVYIRQQQAVDNGQIAAVLIGDEATLKRVYYYPETGKLVLSPANPSYEPYVYAGEEINSVRIIGKAVAFTSNIK